MQAGVGLLILDVTPMFMIIALDVIIIMRFSINFLTVICLPTVCYLSREKPLVKPTAPGSSSSSYICLRSTFPLHFYSNLIQFNLSQYGGGIDNPSYELCCNYLLFVCRYCLHSVAWFSYWIDNLAFITEGLLTSAVLHHPLLFRELPTQTRGIT